MTPCPAVLLLLMESGMAVMSRAPKGRVSGQIQAVTGKRLMERVRSEWEPEERLYSSFSLALTRVNDTPDTQP